MIIIGSCIVVAANLIELATTRHGLRVHVSTFRLMNCGKQRRRLLMVMATAAVVVVLSRSVLACGVDARLVVLMVVLGDSA